MRRRSVAFIFSLYKTMTGMSSGKVNQASTTVTPDKRMDGASLKCFKKPTRMTTNYQRFSGAPSAEGSSYTS